MVLSCHAVFCSALCDARRGRQPCQHTSAQHTEFIPDARSGGQINKYRSQTQRCDCRGSRGVVVWIVPKHWLGKTLTIKCSQCLSTVVLRYLFLHVSLRPFSHLSPFCKPLQLECIKTSKERSVKTASCEITLQPTGVCSHRVIESHYRKLCRTPSDRHANVSRSPSSPSQPASKTSSLLQNISS